MLDLIIKIIVIGGMAGSGLICIFGLITIALETYQTWGDSQCRCRSYHERTGKHVKACPVYREK